MRTPSLRRRKPSGQGVVTLSGHDHSLGPWPANRRKPPPAVQAEYDRLMAEWLANDRRPLATRNRRGGPTVGELILAFWDHVDAIKVLPVPLMFATAVSVTTSSDPSPRPKTAPWPTKTR